MVLDKTARSIYNWMFSIEQGIAGHALLYMKTSRDQEVELRYRRRFENIMKVIS
ncbi:hypothetical protein Hanom_Chr12g01083271 [Helianthus anomalus]